jgi:DHA1 family tetracycline resistance protein-like MFS transporter
MMGGIFYYFSKPGAPVYFPGAAMMTGAVLTVVSVFLARLNLKKHRDSVPHIH